MVIPLYDHNPFRLPVPPWNTFVLIGVNVAVSNHVWGAHATEFLATGTAIRRLSAEHRLPETSPKPTFTLGLDS